MSKDTRKVVFISAIYPFPVDCGKKVVVSGLLKFLKLRCGPENVNYVYIGADFPSAAHRESEFRLIKVGLPGALRRVVNVLWYSFVRKEKPIQEALLYSGELKRRIHAQITSIDPDLIIYDTVRTAQFGCPLNYQSRSVVYLEDLFSVRYSRMLMAFKNMNSRYTDVLGNFAKFVPSTFRPLVQKLKWVQRLLLEREMTLVAKSEVKASSTFSASLLLNDDEVDLLRKRVLHSSVSVIRPLVDAVPTTSIKRNYTGDGTYVFLGSLNLPHNEEGILAFLKYAFSEAVRQMPDVKLRIIGKYPSQRLIDAVNLFQDNVTLEGFVPDLSAVLDTCCAMVIPLTIGSGVKLKTLEALAHGVPCISTALGVESIPVETGKHCYVEEDLRNFPKYMQLLRNVEKNNAMSQNAASFFNKHYSEKTVFESYDRVFGLAQ